MPVSATDQLPALLPLLLAEIPSSISQLLLQSGVPVRLVQARELRQLRFPREAGNGLPAVVLFDSRSSVSRRMADTARQAGIRTVNVAAILSGGGSPSARGTQPAGRYRERLANSQLLLRLKSAVELAGGIWLRVGDYPYPYRSVLCTGDETACDAVVPAGVLEQRVTAAEETSYRAWLLRRFRSGLPVATRWQADCHPADAEVEPRGGNRLPPLLAGSRKCPLLWVTPAVSYLSWREIRRQLKISVSLHEGSWDIRCGGWSAGSMPLLELWRGDHVASFPLRWPVQRVQEADLVFMREVERHPAGIAHRERRAALDTISLARYQRPAA